uniref:Uncharacterized protein n=1 Tax=Tanacetum cinerariifolium TaxID=118510 RepID=A0A699IUI5_TANCI|nr:hypothetical protein [Tanacetum cinerariifolium]
MKAIWNLDVPVDSKASKPSSHTGESSLAKDKSPSHLSPPTLVVGEMHKESHQVTGGPTSFGATSKGGAHPQLSSGNDASADSIAEADPGLSAPNDSIPSQQDQTKYVGDGLRTAQTDSGTNEESRADEISKKIKMEDLSDLLKDIRSAFFTPNSPQDEPIIILDKSEEKEEVVKDKDTHASSHDGELEQQKAKAKAKVASLKSRPSFLDINQLTNLLVTETLNRFTTVVENASGATTKDIPSAGQATASPDEGEKNTTKDAKTNLQNKPVNLLGIDVVEQYHNKKLLFDKYYDKMLKEENFQRS